MLVSLSTKSALERAPPWLEAMPDATALIDEEGTILTVNDLMHTNIQQITEALPQKC